MLSPAGTVALGGAQLPLPAPALRELENLSTRPPHQRSKLWEFGTNLHCSIIGTCLSTADLRQIFLKLGRKEVTSASEHDIHASAVLLAGKQRDGAKLLNKALDRRHRVAINQFDKAKTAAEVRALWQEASKRGEIPGAYWAALTHPACNDALVREIFAEVHMLSHLVGAANRADIRRLRQWEEERAELEARLARKEEQARELAAARDRALAQLEASRASPPPMPVVPIVRQDERLVELQIRVARCEAHNERLEHELAEARAAFSAEQEMRRAAEQRGDDLCREIEALEASFAEASGEAESPPRLDLNLLYVGGKAARIGHLRDHVERTGAAFLYHDGGVEERGGLLPGLVSRADAVLFPVDCISHAAMLRVKRLCRQSEKRFLPLRSAGLAPLYAALNQLAQDQAKD